MAARTVISEFEARRVERMLLSLFAGRLRRGEAFRIEGSCEGNWLSVQWELADDDRRSVYAVEARVDLHAQRLRERQAIDLIYDLLGERFGEHLGDREPFTGLEWEAIDFAGATVFARGQMRSDVAEAAADAILHADALERSRAMEDGDPDDVPEDPGA